MNFIQLYIGYIGASRAYGMHLEILDVALFLTNEGVTMYWGHAHRWSRKWHSKTPAAVQVPEPRTDSPPVRPDANRPQVAASAGGLLGTGGVTAVKPTPMGSGYAPGLSVVPLHTNKAPKSSRRSAVAAEGPGAPAHEGALAKVMAG